MTEEPQPVHHRDSLLVIAVAFLFAGVFGGLVFFWILNSLGIIGP